MSALCNDKTGERSRFHYYEPVMQRAINDAAANVGLTVRATGHTLPHHVATHILQSGTDIHTVQELLDYRSGKPTQLYTRYSPSSLERLSELPSYVAPCRGAPTAQCCDSPGQ